MMASFIKKGYTGTIKTCRDSDPESVRNRLLVTSCDSKDNVEIALTITSSRAFNDISQICLCVCDHCSTTTVVLYATYIKG